MRTISCVVLLCLSSCVSRAAVSARSAAESELEEPIVVEPSPGPAAASTGGCAGLARAVAARHPAGRAATQRGRAALARSHARASLPPPRAAFEVWDFPIGAPETADEDGMYMVSLGQEFPAPGMRSGEARAEAEEARADAAEARERARMIYGEVAHACVDWTGATAQIEHWQRYVTLVRSAREASIAAFRAGAPLAGVARLEAELASAERKLATAEEEARQTRRTLEELTRGLAALPTRPPPLSEISTPPPSLAAAPERDDVRAARGRVEGALAQSDVAEASALEPEVEVRATYMQMPGARAGLGAMVGMSLPWLWGGGSDAREAAEHDVSAARSELESAQRRARAEVARAEGQSRALARSLQMLTEREIPAAERAMDAHHASTTGALFDLSEWLESAFALRQARLDEVETRTALAHALVDLAIARGTPTAREGRRAP
jgi:outer membrane protein TolC